MQAVFDWVKQTRDGFVNVAKSPDARTMPYQLEVTPTEYNSAVPPRGTQSVVFKVYQDVGGTKPQTFYKAFNWDQTLRWPIVLDTGGQEKTQPLFQPGANPWPTIFPLVEAELEKQTGHQARDRAAGGAEPGDLRELRDPERLADLLLRPGRDPAGVGGRAFGDDPAGAGRLDDRLTRGREAVHLAVAGRGDHAAVVADRHPDGQPGRLRQRIAVDRVAVGGENTSSAMAVRRRPRRTV